MCSQSPSSQSPSDVTKNVEITWGDLLELFARRWIWIAGSVLISISLAVGALTVIKPQAEAEAIIRIGQIVDVTTGANQPVEPFADVTERLRLTSYLTEALTKLEAVEKSETRFLQQSFRSELISPTGLIRIKVRAYTPSHARAFLKAMVDNLVDKHRKRFEEALQIKFVLQQNLSEMLDGLLRDREELARRLSANSSTTILDNVAEKAILSQTLAQLNGSIRDVEQRKILMNERVKLNAMLTGLFDQIAVKDVAVPLGAYAILSVGAIAGLVLGLLIALLIDYRARSKNLLRRSAFDKAQSAG